MFVVNDFSVSLIHNDNLICTRMIIIIKFVFSVLICLCFTAVSSSFTVSTANESLSRVPRQSNYQGCILPKHPQFGKWVVYKASLQPQPETVVPSGTILQVSCLNQYKLDGAATTVCFNNEWTTKIGQCLKTCPSLHNTALVSVACIYNNRTMPDCKDAVDGTIARFTCADFYEDKSLERNPIHACFNGKWNNRAPECVPICGQKNPGESPTLIVAGSNVTKGGYPWQVAIYNKQTKVLLCGGSLLNQRVVLTAAHCVTDENGTVMSEKKFILAVGKYYRNFNDSRDKDEAQFSPVYKIFVPRQYKGDIQNYFGDIAVLITKTTFTLSTRIQPVCVDWASTHLSLSDPSRSKHGYVSGWGFTAEFKDPSEVLKDLKVPLISDDQCKQYLPDDYKKIMTDDKLCAGFLDAGTSVCRGDSGGGLVTMYENRYYVIGVVSLSPQAPALEGGCDNQQYTLFTRVSDYINIIFEQEVRHRPSIFEEVDCEHDPHCKTAKDISTTTTTTSRPFPQISNSCSLPNHPSFGQWKNIFTPNSSLPPGELVLPGSVLTVSCDQGYQLVGQKLTMCENGRWVPELASCSKVCPNIISTPTLEVTCKKDKTTKDCIDAVDGTIAKFKCATFYENPLLNRNPVRICQNGSWDFEKPVCHPVCGQKTVDSTPLVVNGQNVTKGNYPWQVAIYSSQQKQLICGGSLINQKMIVTAAHCITNVNGKMNEAKNYIVAVGKYFRTFDYPGDFNEAQFSELEHMFIPRQYEGSKQNYLGDIAILIAKKMFRLSRRVQPVCLDKGGNYDPRNNDYGYVTGWGFTTESGKPSEVLKELKVPSVSLSTCRTHLPEDYDVYLTHDKMCAGYVDNTSAVCSGDSGGGLVFKHDGRYYLTGIVSLSPRSPILLTSGCDSQNYGLYTKVSEYINEFILRKEAEFKPRSS